MTTSTKSILMFGATGVIGTFIIDELARQLQSGTFDRLAIFTSQSTVDNKASTIQSLQSQNVEVFVGDVNDKSVLQSVLSGQSQPLNPSASTISFDTVISAAGRNAILTQIPLLEVAEQTPNIKRFFPSEYGTDIEYDAKTSPSEPPHQLKLQVRKCIRENIKRLEYTYLVTGPYSELWLNKAGNPRIGSYDVQAKKATVLYDGKGQVSFTSMPEYVLPNSLI